MQGLVVKSTGSWYIVRGSDGNNYECKPKGSFRLRGIRSTNPVAVGDHVSIAVGDEGRAYITEIADRKNYIIRRASNLSKQSHILAANIDQAFLVVTVNYPETSTVFIDRFLASAEAYRVPVTLVFNKTDLLNDDYLQLQGMIIDLYESLHYRCFATDARKDAARELLLPELKGKTTLFSGNSGVGKSTLLNTLLPGQDLRTAPISEAHNKGMHTTTYSEMLPVSGGGWLIDTPGIKGFGTFDIERAELTSYFRDIFHHSRHCRFDNCTHTHEPGCAVIQALQEQMIAPSRYQSYLSMLDDKDEGKYREAY